MNERILGMVCMALVMLAMGCSEDKCKHTLSMLDNEKGQQSEGPAMKCNIVVTCEGNWQYPRTVTVYNDGMDPRIVDRHNDQENINRCIKKVQEEYPGNDKRCKIDASPALICLDVDGGSGPGPSGSTGGTLVTVSAGVTTGGDHWFYDGIGGAGGAGGAGAAGFSAEPGPGDS